VIQFLRWFQADRRPIPDTFHPIAGTIRHFPLVPDAAFAKFGGGGRMG